MNTFKLQFCIFVRLEAFCLLHYFFNEGDFSCWSINCNGHRRSPGRYLTPGTIPPAWIYPGMEWFLPHCNLPIPTLQFLTGDLGSVHFHLLSFLSSPPHRHTQEDSEPLIAKIGSKHTSADGAAGCDPLGMPEVAQMCPGHLDPVSPTAVPGKGKGWMAGPRGRMESCCSALKRASTPRLVHNEIIPYSYTLHAKLHFHFCLFHTQFSTKTQSEKFFKRTPPLRSSKLLPLRHKTLKLVTPVNLLHD